MGKPVVKETYICVEELLQKLLGSEIARDETEILIPLGAIHNAIARCTQLITYGSDAEN